MNAEKSPTVIFVRVNDGENQVDPADVKQIDLLF